MCPSVMLVVAIPVVLFEVLLALDHLSAEGTPSYRLVQDRGPTYRGGPPGALSIMVLSAPHVSRGVSRTRLRAVLA